MSSAVFSKGPDFKRNQDLFTFRKNSNYIVHFSATNTLTNTAMVADRMRQHRAEFSPPDTALCLFWRSHRHPYHIAHRIRCLPHHIRHGVDIGAEGKARTVMSKMLERVFTSTPFFSDNVSMVCRKESRSYILPVSGNGNIYGFPRYFLCPPTTPPPAARAPGHGWNRGLGLTHHQFSLGAGLSLRNGDSSILHVQVQPEEGQQLSPFCN